MKTTILKIIAAITFIAALGIAGTADYTETVIQTLSYDQYWKIVEDLGGTASDRKVVKHYMNNRAKYDSIR